MIIILGVSINVQNSIMANQQCSVNATGGNQNYQQQLLSTLQPSLQSSNLAGQSTLLEAELDLHFSLQYPHFIKRDGNRYVHCNNCFVNCCRYTVLQNYCTSTSTSEYH